MLRFFGKVVCCSVVWGLGFSQPAVYVANSNSDTVSVIPTRNNIASAPSIELPGVSDAWLIEITPDGAYAYVSGYSSEVISVIRTSDNKVIDTIPTGGEPHGIAITPDGAYVYVTNFIQEGTVSVIRTSDNKVIQKIPVGGDPYDIAITPDGAYAYVTNHDDHSGEVSVIRTSDNKVIDTITDNIGADLRGIAITPDGAHAYVANDDTGGTVKVIRTSDNKVIHTIEGAGAYPSEIAITPDGAYVYVGHGDANSTISVIKTSDYNFTEITTTGTGGTRSMVITPDGAYVYLTGFFVNEVSVLRTSDNALLPNDIQVGEGPRGIAITPMFGTFSYTMEYDQTLSGKYHYAQINWVIEGIGYKLFRNGKFIKEFGPDKQSYNDYDVNPSITYIYTLEVTQKNNAEGSTYGPTYVEKFTAWRSG